MDYRSRLNKFHQTLTGEDLDGFVVTHPANLRYLCGYTGSNGLLLFSPRQRAGQLPQAVRTPHILHGRPL